MNFLNFIWVIFLIIVIIPVIRQRMIDSSRYLIIRSLEEKRKTNLSALITN